MRIRKNTIVLIITVLVSFLLAMRGNDTPDTAAYKAIYQHSMQNLNYEYLYIYLNRIFYKSGVPFFAFLLMLTLTLFLSWYKLTNQILKNQLIAFLSFLPFYGFYFFGIILRASIAVVICYLAIVILFKMRNLKGYVFYYILILIASGFHKSALIFLILPVVAQQYYNKKSLLLFLLLSASLPLFNSSLPIIKNLSFKYLSFVEFNRVEGYIINSEKGMTYSLTLLKNLTFAGIFIIMRNSVIMKKSIYNFFLNIYLIGCFLLSLFSFVIAGSRLGMMFLFFEFILLSILYESSNMKKINAKALILIAAILNFIAIIQQGNGLIW